MDDLFNRKTVRDVDVSGKRVLVRVDFNVPLSDGVVTDDTRLQAALPTIEYLLGQGSKVILMSHLGRPKDSEDKFRLTPVAGRLSKLLSRPVTKADETVGSSVEGMVAGMKPGDVVLLENLRFNPGEKKNDAEFSRRLARLGDVYVDDAFGAAHRGHASVTGVTEYLPSVSGLLLEREVKTLTRLLENPEAPFVAVLGGNKVSDKIGVIDRFLDIVDVLMIGGGMAFTFLAAKGYGIGNSLFQAEELDHSRAMLEKAARRHKVLELPVDVVVAPEISPEADHRVVDAGEIPEGWMGLDIGPRTAEIFVNGLAQARTIFWNGPMGVFEIDAFAQGTRAVAEAVAANSGDTIAGGGDTDAALRMFGLEDKVSFVSTGGGASLELLEKGTLPGVEVLERV